ncbi:MAG TPA: daunorubicin/doxorubicin resistance ABC transporter ATP-binding protein DrrA [Chloroflexi bacterium]|jgi:ABC-2 type transport system ATP-binding protein|nr:daunorubicin/doxorubicin resistance ABC transporter ATP-binding protein DrrA [Chloroflexota bacterium]HAF20969.1 daunorubicin/doxorubicin resistance ABC transporter ATP-binding protein DrrA [Chloroflexota bacterium]
MTSAAISAERLARSFGATHALVNVSLEVPSGSVCALLGRNGAGKTTAVRILTTLLSADSGRAQVAGFDVFSQADKVRTRIGVTGQTATMDELLTGQENLDIVGRFCHLGAATSRRRANDLLHEFDLVDAKDRLVKKYSGGMKRRLDLAASLIAEPEVLFLDEPTTGLDPISRREMWAAIRALVSRGTTVLLTTQYLDEADQLADTIVVIDRGLVVAQGTPEQLKASIGRPHVRVTLPDQDAAALERVRSVLGDRAEIHGLSVSMPASNGLASLREVVAQLERMGLPIYEVGLEHPSLDEVFSTVTGHSDGAGLTARATEKDG